MCINVYIYIYIYMCVCVCSVGRWVCLWMAVRNQRILSSASLNGVSVVGHLSLPPSTPLTNSTIAPCALFATSIGVTSSPLVKLLMFINRRKPSASEPFDWNLTCTGLDPSPEWRIIICSKSHCWANSPLVIATERHPRIDRRISWKKKSLAACHINHRQKPTWVDYRETWYLTTNHVGSSFTNTCRTTFKDWRRRKRKNCKTMLLNSYQTYSCSRCDRAYLFLISLIRYEHTCNQRRPSP